jgi:hypothetical protein
MRNEFQPLFRAIQQKTTEKTISWASTGVPSQYSLPLKSGTLLFDMFPDQDEGPPHFQFTLLTAKGEKSAEVWVTTGDPDWHDTDDLFRLVEWQANKADETVSAMLRELEGDDVVGIGKVAKDLDW